MCKNGVDLSLEEPRVCDTHKVEVRSGRCRPPTTGHVQIGHLPQCTLVSVLPCGQTCP